jgi:hypothetical protein
MLIDAAVLWFLFRIVRSQFRTNEPSEAVEDLPDDPLTGVPSPRKNPPRGRAGAVALALPEEDDEDYTLPPRTGSSFAVRVEVRA